MKTNLLTLAFLFVLGSCGGGGAAGAAGAESGDVRITANDAMQYDTKSMRGRVGKPIKITLENVGKMPKATMGHNLVVLKPGTDVNKFGIAAAAAKDTDYIPADQSEVVVAHTALLGPGETGTIEFAPAAAGEYPYLCSFPGHFGTMRGKIVVSE